MSTANNKNGGNSTYYGGTSSDFMASAHDNGTSLTDALSALFNVITDQKAALDAGVSQMQALRQSLVDHHDSIDFASIDFGTERDAALDHLDDLQANFDAQSAELQSLMENYSATVEIATSITAAIV
jgi:hypothetical protein